MVRLVSDIDPSPMPATHILQGGELSNHILRIRLACDVVDQGQENLVDACILLSSSVALQALSTYDQASPKGKKQSLDSAAKRSPMSSEELVVEIRKGGDQREVGRILGRILLRIPLCLCSLRVDGNPRVGEGTNLGDVCLGMCEWRVVGHDR